MGRRGLDETAMHRGMQDTDIKKEIDGICVLVGYEIPSDRAGTPKFCPPGMA